MAKTFTFLLPGVNTVSLSLVKDVVGQSNISLGLLGLFSLRHRTDENFPLLERSQVASA